MARVRVPYTGVSLHPTLELLDPLNPLRRRMALGLLLLGTMLALVALAASWRRGVDPVDQVFLPLLALGFSLLALILWRFPHTAPWVLTLTHVLVASYLLATLAYQLLIRPNPIGLSPAAYWVPFVYFSGFLFFQTQQAVRLAGRLRQAVAALMVPPVVGITISIGVAGARPDDSPPSLLKRADEALYQAKRRGKNRVEVG